MSSGRLFAAASPGLLGILDRALDGHELSQRDACELLRARGPDFHALLRAADLAREQDRGDDVSFVICRNINFTNVCYVGCSFCGFSRHRDDDDAFDHPMETLLEKARDAVARGATEVCIQGGIHPQKDHRHYHEILTTLHAALPELHIHAFSPEEIDYGHRKSDMPLAEYLGWLVDAGLGTMPGTAAEILDDEVRQVICADKITTAQWLEVMEAAHTVGFRTTATIMYGHVERPEHWARHLLRIRDLQQRTGGFTEFVPLGFIHRHTDLYREDGARAGATMPEDLRTAIMLRELEGMSYEEIATTMECPVGTVRSRIFRAREAIDKRLRPLLD